MPKINEDILIYPDDLSKKRYISFDFYAPEFAKDVIDGLIGIIDAGTTALAGDTDVAKTKALKSVTKIADSFVNVFEQSKKRFKVVKQKDGSIAVTGDVATTNLQKDFTTYKGSIFLPVPNSLGESITNNWDEQSGTVSTLLNLIPGAEIAQKALTEISKFTGTRGSLINPDKTQSYTGSTPRSLDFEWTLLPNSREEAATILKIIRTLKRFSSPETQAAKALLLAPYFCTITFNNKHLDDTTRYNDMVITGIDVGYGVGNMEMFSDGMVKQISLSIKMVERRVNTMEDWQEQDSRDKKRVAGNSLSQLFGQGTNDEIAAGIDSDGFSNADLAEFEAF